MTEHPTATFDGIDRRQFLRAGVGIAGATAALPIFTGNAAAHFPEKLTIDIKPKSEKNRIVLGSSETITVAVLQTDGFDPTSKPVHYRFGAPDVIKNGGGARPAGSPQLKDINGDGKMDLVLEFPLAETGFSGDEKKGKLIWERHKGAEHGFSGTGPVTVIDGEQPTATTNATTDTTANTITGTAAKQTTTTATTKPMTTTATQEPTTQTTATAASTATTAAPATTIVDSNTVAGESNTTTGATTTATQGSGFGTLAALGGIASIGAYLFARNSDNE